MTKLGENRMLAGDFLALLIATFGVAMVLFYAKDEPRMRIFTRVLVTMIIFLWVGAGLLWGV